MPHPPWARIWAVPALPSGQYLAAVSSAAPTGTAFPKAADTAKGCSQRSRAEANRLSSPGPGGLWREKTEKGSLKCLSYCRITVVCPSESLDLSTNEQACLLENTEEVGIFNLSCFCSHRTEASGFLSDWQLQEQWDSTTQQQMNPIVLLIMKSNKKWICCLNRRNYRISSLKNHTKYKELDELGGSLVGTQSQRCPGAVENTHSKTSSLVRFLGEAQCHWVPAAHNKENKLETHCCLFCSLLIFKRHQTIRTPWKQSFCCLLQPDFAMWPPRDQDPESISFP